MEPNAISATSWQSFEKQLRTYVRSRVDSQYVDDVVGNILLRLVQHSDALKAAKNPAAFVQRAAINAVTDHYRRRATERRTMAEVEAAASDTGKSEVSGEDAALSSLARCLVPFINGLPTRYREALTLTEIRQMGQRQAAERLGLSTSGLKSRVHRGREMLKHALTRCCALELDRRGGVMSFEQRTTECSKEC